ncbi:fumarylacetoacetate hydrolase family protein [Citromicrobium bathyomarinum]|uniref:fumarylacetoacetate hydrolase family protein n=1 Tax=Citromicrobium bathyomarinum TaxID=72174 RepID=UPI00315AEC43
MRLATRANGTPDGELVVVSQDGARCLPAGNKVPNLLAAIGDWGSASATLQALVNRLEQGEGEPLEVASLAAPLPRSWQWLDGSAFDTHGELMQIAFEQDPLHHERPLMYQGMSDRFLAPREDVAFPREEDGVDFEGEFGVIVDAVPMGVTPEEALDHIKLVVQINDWSLRAFAVPEMVTGFGFILAKPASTIAPFAVTPDELGDAWQNGRVALDLCIDWNGEKFGHANGREMAVGFHELVAHAATTRSLVAGTVIGSGTVANKGYAQVGSSCISERRAIEIIADGKPATGFMRFGDTVRMEAQSEDGRAPFGAIEQQVVKHTG